MSDNPYQAQAQPQYYVSSAPSSQPGVIQPPRWSDRDLNAAALATAQAATTVVNQGAKEAAAFVSAPQPAYQATVTTSGGVVVSGPGVAVSATTYGQPPPGYIYQPASTAPHAVVEVSPGQPLLQAPVASATFGAIPQPVVCPFCNSHVVTTTHSRIGTMTWVVFGALILFGCWLFCCLIPFFIDSCKDVEHSCPNCNQVLGLYQRMK